MWQALQILQEVVLKLHFNFEGIEVSYFTSIFPETITKKTLGFPSAFMRGAEERKAKLI